MAAFPSVPMDEFLSKYPSVIRKWIEQDLEWKIDEIRDMLIEDSASFYPCDAIKATATKKTENEHISAQAEFIKSLISDDWQMAKEDIDKYFGGKNAK